MEYPKFSVLMSLYIKEKAEYFDECMQSILRQTVLPSEIVIVYDCPLNKEYAMRNYKRACLVKPWCFISNITYYFRIVKALHQEGGF